MKLLDRVELNPTITMQKGKVYPFVEMANVGMFMREPLAIESKAFSSGMKFEDGDTVVARITPCLQNGKGFFCKDIGTGFGSTEFLVFRPKDETVDNRYLYYLFQTNEIRDKMIKSMVGATGRQRVNNDVFNSIDVNFPDIDAQRRIGEALFCYDDLIENNRKQLKVLDSALHLLYKEWFEKGGSHDEPMLPSGWEKKTVKDISSILRRGISPKYDEDGTYYVINQKCIRTSIMDMNEARRQSKTYPAEINLIDSDIVICSTGTGTLGRVGQVYGNHPAAIDKFMDEHDFSLKALVEATDFDKLALVVQGANAMCETTETKKRFEIQARELFRCFKYVERKEVDDTVFHYKNAISAVYEQLQEKRKHADNSELMAQINEIVSGYVGVTQTDADDDSKKFDISNIDFDRLRKEFEKAQNKNLMFKDLQDIVEERLLRMMKNNPLRINYYERYQEIVDEYNKENRKDEIAVVFENLMNLVNDLDEEQKRYVREGFDSDEELTMFDLLVKDSLTKEEIKQVKKLAQTMLAKIKARIHELDHWRDKEETQSIISVMIRDLLWAELPESYDDVAIADYRQQIYEYVYNAYPAA